MLKRLCFLLCAGAFLAAASTRGAGASAQEAVSLQVNNIDLSAFPEIQTTVTVVDGTQRPISGLPPEAFSVSSGESEVPVTSIGSALDAGLGMGVVLAFDTSGSMEGAPMQAAREAGKALVGQLGPNDQVAVVAFSDGVRNVLGFTQDRAAAIAAIDGLVPAGNTALYQAVAQSSEIATSSALARRTVIFLSDGLDFGNASTVDAAGSLSTVERTGVPYFVVGLGDQVDQGYLEQLAGASRGQLLLAPGPEKLTEMYQNVGSILRHQYIVTVDGSRLSPGEALSLRFAVASGSATGVADASLTVPGEASPAPTMPPAATPIAAPQITQAPVAEQPESGSSSLAPLLVAVAAGGIATAGIVGYYFWRRQSRTVVPEMEFERFRDTTGPAPSFPAIESAVHAEATAYLQATSGDGSQTYPLGDWPVTVGFTSDCTLYLPETAVGDSERVRIWRREGRYMLHNLSRMGTVLVAGKPATWAILEDGDEVQIGQARLMFRDRPPVRQDA